MTVKSVILIFSLLTGYLTSTWFVFGSPHPCEILLVRQKNYHIQLAEKHHEENLKSWRDVARKTFPAKDYERFVRNIHEYSNASGRKENLAQSVVQELRRKIREMSLGQCTWEALNWRTPSEQDPSSNELL